MLPRLVAPWKNSTLLIEPSLSEAEALIGTLAGEPKLAPFTGVVRLILGAASTITFTTLDVAVKPRLSVPRAVKAYDPPETLFQVSE